MSSKRRKGTSGGAASEAMPPPACPAEPSWWRVEWEELPLVRRISFAQPIAIRRRNIHELVAEERRRLGELRTYLPVLSTLRENLERYRDALTAPHQRVERASAESRIARVSQRVKEIETGADLRRFEEKIESYFLAHADAEDRAGPSGDGGGTSAPARPSSAATRELLSDAVREETRDRDMAQAVVEQMVAHLMPDPSAPKIAVVNLDECRTCSVPLEKSMKDHVLRCPKCNFCCIYLDVTAAALTYGDDVELAETSVSHRKSHWNEFINSKQSREQITESEETLTRVALYLHRKRGVTRNSEITVPLVYEAMHALRMPQKQLKRAVQVATRLGSMQPPVLSELQTYICKTLFQIIESRYNQLFPGELWFNNPFCFLCICRMMGWSQFYENTPLVQTSREELIASEAKMQRIFDSLGWEYRPIPIGGAS